MHTALDVRALSSRYAVRPLLRPDEVLSRSSGSDRYVRFSVSV